MRYIILAYFFLTLTIAPVRKGWSWNCVFHLVIATVQFLQIILLVDAWRPCSGETLNCCLKSENKRKRCHFEVELPYFLCKSFTPKKYGKNDLKSFLKRKTLSSKESTLTPKKTALQDMI